MSDEIVAEILMGHLSGKIHRDFFHYAFASREGSTIYDSHLFLSLHQLQKFACQKEINTPVIVPVMCGETSLVQVSHNSRQN